MNFKNELFEKYLQNLFWDDESNLLSAVDVLDLKCNFGDPYESFHCKEVYMVEKNDSRFCGIRANHFVVEVGYSEEDWGEDYNVFIITGNHKGSRCITILRDLTDEGHKKINDEFLKRFEQKIKS
ncbi:hypothetical protein ACMVYQ_05855 [Staphylococcus capitis]|uniref:hypothetical protein n=1 Tax=Staphylococcus capitis TaxID=29388 RepID=UPI0039EBF94B